MLELAHWPDPASSASGLGESTAKFNMKEISPLMFCEAALCLHSSVFQPQWSVSSNEANLKIKGDVCAQNCCLLQCYHGWLLPLLADSALSLSITP